MKESSIRKFRSMSTGIRLPFQLHPMLMPKKPIPPKTTEA